MGKNKLLNERQLQICTVLKGVFERIVALEKINYEDILQPTRDVLDMIKIEDDEKEEITDRLIELINYIKIIR